MAFMAEDLLDASTEPYCIDRQEWPGAGKPPELGLSLAEAASRCQARGSRLCQPTEWEDACRGPDRASFPYGSKFIDQKCNLRRGGIVATGSFPECQSASGAFDMSGNAAEWDASGAVRGGSATDGTRGRCSQPRRRKRRDLAAQRADIGFRCCADPLHQSPPPGKKRGPG
jgi:formylglycine-generating enzyme required for sulfatase activity